MIGFFEHQYLSYKKNHIKNLLALSKADGHMHEKEVDMLFKIGKRYGLKGKSMLLWKLMRHLKLTCLITLMIK
jgi:hypothetical protein